MGDLFPHRALIERRCFARWSLLRQSLSPELRVIPGKLGPNKKRPARGRVRWPLSVRWRRLGGRVGAAWEVSPGGGAHCPMSKYIRARCVFGFSANDNFAPSFVSASAA